MSLGKSAINLQEFHGDDAQATLLKASNDFAS
jgi:hypothetical protein